ncbi:hypothetical protein P4G95_04595 [Burkholderia vietnamiensis]|uniref:hypothetical protein n=1 Tax=Burkholderia vietnamiensis TaxID=60552 RepID=UPI0015948EBE|nr:hypothetical protein [Burkholderia vietnamiensis]WHU93040.1 hypothetical protein P4G95_04595 [Burkholderia vietnamiensis]
MSNVSMILPAVRSGSDTGWLSGPIAVSMTVAARESPIAKVTKVTTRNVFVRPFHDPPNSNRSGRIISQNFRKIHDRRTFKGKCAQSA